MRRSSIPASVVLVSQYIQATSPAQSCTYRVVDVTNSLWHISIERSYVQREQVGKNRAIDVLHCLRLRLAQFLLSHLNTPFVGDDGDEHRGRVDWVALVFHTGEGR